MVDNKLFLFGGISLKSESYNNVYSFDFGSQSPSSLIRNLLQKNVTDFESSLSLLLFLSTATKQQNLLFDGSKHPEGSIPCPRWSHTMVAIGRDLFVFGGFGSLALSDLWKFNIGLPSSSLSFFLLLHQSWVVVVSIARRFQDSDRAKYEMKKTRKSGQS